MYESFDSAKGKFKCNTCSQSMKIVFNILLLINYILKYIFLLAFSRKYTFLIHEATHRGEDPKLPCRFCPKTYPSMKLLNEHSRTEHSDKYFRCEQCPKFFLIKASFDDHVLSHA